MAKATPVFVAGFAYTPSRSACGSRHTRITHLSLGCHLECWSMFQLIRGCAC